jgi:hypothetical protein
MGKTRDTGFLNNCVFTDSSNNVGIGAAANASFKLQVTGATNLTGALSGTSATFSGLTQDAVQTVIRMSGRNASNQIKALDFKLTAGTPLWTISTAAEGTDAGLNIMPNGTSGLALAYTGAATFTQTGGSFLIDTNGQVISKQALDVATAGGRFTGQSNRGSLGAIHIEQTTTGADGGYIDFRTSNSGSTTPTAKMRLDASGNVGIGTSSPAGKLDVYIGAYQNLIFKAESTYQSSLRFNESTNGPRLYSDAQTEEFRMQQSFTSTGFLSFYTGPTERMRITSGGFIKASNNGSYIGVNGAYHEFRNTNTSATDNVAIITVLGSTSNNASNYHYIAVTDGSDRMFVYGNGNIVNTNGSYGTLASDRRLKENIVSATPKLYDIMRLNVVNFNLIGNEDKHIGFIAQEMQEVFPSFVYQNDTRKYDDDGNLISGYEDSLGLKVGMEFAILTKCIQEQQAQIEELKAMIAAK